MLSYIKTVNTVLQVSCFEYVNNPLKLIHLIVSLFVFKLISVKKFIDIRPELYVFKIFICFLVIE